MEVYKDWTNFKTEVTNRSMEPQFYEEIKGAGTYNQYKIYAKDGFFTFECWLSQDGGADVTDFEDNYKDNWNKKQDHRNAEGLIRYIQSPRPDGVKTYFTGAGDTGGLSSGNRMMFKLLATDTSKEVEVTMNEDIYAYRGTVQFKDAPFGAYINFEVVHPTIGVLACYVTKVPLFGTGIIVFESQDVELIPLGLIIRSRVTNADGTGIYDAAAEFKAAVFIETYRATLT